MKAEMSCKLSLMLVLFTCTSFIKKITPQINYFHSWDYNLAVLPLVNLRNY